MSACRALCPAGSGQVKDNKTPLVGVTVPIDRASAQALGVDLGEIFPVPKADGEDLTLTVIGILAAPKPESG